MKNLLVIAILFLGISLSAQLQLQNGGFENWTALTTHPYETELLSLYAVPGVTTGTIEYWTHTHNAGVCRTTDSYDGTYALIVHNWYGYVWTSAEHHEKLTAAPTQIQGYFKYLSNTFNSVQSTGTCQVFIKDDLNDTIGSGSFEFTHQTNYTNFTVPISYTSTNTPDSIIIKFTNAYQSCDADIICNLLYLDKIEMLTTPLSIVKNINELSFIFDPLNNEILIKGLTQRMNFRMIDLSGNIVYATNVNFDNPRLTLPQIQSGVYIIELMNENQRYSDKIAIY